MVYKRNIICECLFYSIIPDVPSVIMDETIIVEEGPFYKKMSIAWLLLGVLSIVTMVFAFLRLGHSHYLLDGSDDLTLVLPELLILAVIGFFLYYTSRFKQSRKAISISLVFLSIVTAFTSFTFIPLFLTGLDVSYLMIVVFLLASVMFLISIVYIGLNELRDGRSVMIVAAPTFIAAILSISCFTIILYNISGFSGSLEGVPDSVIYLAMGWIVGCVMVALFILARPNGLWALLFSIPLVAGVIYHLLIRVQYSGPQETTVQIMSLFAGVILLVALILVLIFWFRQRSGR